MKWEIGLFGLGLLAGYWWQDIGFITWRSVLPLISGILSAVAQV